MKHEHHKPMPDQDFNIKTPWTDWTPLAVVFAYILGLSLIVMNLTTWSWYHFLSYSMGFFFIVFSLFKMINIKGFAEGYSQYDLISKKWYGWGFVYPFVELALGILYIGLVNDAWLHIATIVISILVVISVSIELKKHGQFYCACLGTVLKVPLTKVSLAEYLLMAVMAALMLAGSFGFKLF